MCSVAYWRWVDSNKQIRVCFVASKCRVSPVKPVTIPRLELQAAVMAAQLANTLQSTHRIKTADRYFWSDSTTVLQWIHNNKRSYKPYVAHRLGEIDELTRINEWRYVLTSMNVADRGTRENYDSLRLDGEWFNGPTFLYEAESSWPTSSVIIPSVDECDLECVTNILQVEHLHEHAAVPDPMRFSSWIRLLRSMSAVLKFISKCQKREFDECTSMKRAELQLLRYAQTQSFSTEIGLIKGGKCLNKNSKLLTLSPFLDEDGLLRVGGRIDVAADVTYSMKHPVILDGRNKIARLIVQYYHVNAGHGNQEMVVNNLKQKYWLIRMRPTVKEISKKCMLCKLRRVKPRIPKMGDLPSARVAHHQRPFTHCRIDLFGPMEVTIGRRREKRYGVIFTCLTVRAIHLETVSSFSTDSLIMALRRMASRRGWPAHLYSDNGTNLRGADAELKRAVAELDEKTLQTTASIHDTQWTFIPPASSHWGGAWERLIRSVKVALKVVLKERAPREEVLNTLMAEVEAMVNGRPLSHVSVEVDSKESLTPNHFLLGSSSLSPQMGNFNDSDLFLRRQWRIAQRLADMFWRRWVTEVLPELIPRQKWTTELHAPLQVGDLVFVVDPSAMRNVWPRGVVEEVFTGKDGNVRVVQIRTQLGSLKRSVARVAKIPLDV
ncbi:uncharacterized protein LOC123660582 [Melitaea cinxia]|uniref:uncharacterized protein LOC123660582 n=1 Tax=Melitaea cinxia TaxID=113334 RepID=UPI001E271CEB|nr:uncharacterized protein LOC123660582 [Melitaea cinxia]